MNANSDEENNIIKCSKKDIAALAHEIRNPLALIRANLQYIELSDRQKNKKNYDIIYREIDRITFILNSSMDITSKDNLFYKQFNVKMLINEIELIFGYSLKNSNIDLFVVCEDIEINADYNKLKQVIINVLQNAKEGIEAAGRKKDGIIELHVYDSGGLLNISVYDNGIGINNDDLKKVGTPFYTSKDNGCGLGISISRGIIEKHKGTFTITANTNSGAKVLITLPLNS